MRGILVYRTRRFLINPWGVECVAQYEGHAERNYVLRGDLLGAISIALGSAEPPVVWVGEDTAFAIDMDGRLTAYRAVYTKEEPSARSWVLLPPYLSHEEGRYLHLEPLI